ncbi:MAG: type II secretion system protein [Nitrospira sp.]|nr:type II secretion system protein [Nitrospira sp.]
MRIHVVSAKQGESGFSYIMLMIAILVMGVAMSVAARQWKVMVQREQEADLLAKGIEIQNALALYSATKKAGRVMPPQTLVELTKQPKPFLRKVYLDPVGRVEWDLLRAPTGGIMGVRSKSRSKPIKQRAFPLVVRHFEGKPTYYDWVFQFPNPSMPTLVPPGMPTQGSVPGQSAAPGGSGPGSPLPPTNMTPPPVSPPLPTAS